LTGANTYGGLTLVNGFGGGTVYMVGTNTGGGGLTIGTGGGNTLVLANATNGGIATGTLTMQGSNISSLTTNVSISDPWF